MALPATGAQTVRPCPLGNQGTGQLCAPGEDIGGADEAPQPDTGRKAGQGGEEREGRRREGKGGVREGRGEGSLCAGLPSPTTIPRSNNQLCK